MTNGLSASDLMGHSISNMVRGAEAKVVPKANFCSQEKNQQQPYGQEKTDCHNLMLILRVASESSVLVSLMCLEASLPFPRNGPFYFLLSSLTSHLLAFWLCCPPLLATGYSPAASLQLLHHVFAADFLFAPLVSTLYTCVCEKAKGML